MFYSIVRRQLKQSLSDFEDLVPAGKEK